MPVDTQLFYSDPSPIERFEYCFRSFMILKKDGLEHSKKHCLHNASTKTLKTMLEFCDGLISFLTICKKKTLRNYEMDLYDFHYFLQRKISMKK